MTGRNGRTQRMGWMMQAIALVAIASGCAPTRGPGVVAVQAPAEPPPAVEFFVSPGGDDRWSGRRPEADEARADGPFATLERARDAVRALKAAGPLTGLVAVTIREGIHAPATTLKLEARDGGTAAAPIVWRSRVGERPVLTGGRVVTGFAPLTNGILRADLARCGLKGAKFRQLVFDGRRQPLARYPNFDEANPYGGGWAYADGAYIPMYKDIPDESRRTFRMKPQDARTWAHPEEGEVFVFPRYNWWNNIVRIKTVEPATRTVTLVADCSYPVRPTDRYYVQGLLEELDAPGEWYLDVAASVLYFRPPSTLEGRTVLVPAMRTILDLGPGTANIEFRGLTFECSEGTAIGMKDATNCRISACTIRNVGDYSGHGVAISGGASNVVFGCDIHDIGSCGVSLSGGDRRTLTPAANAAENNYIHHIGVYHKQGVGISLSGVGQRAAHNLIHDGPRMGIMFSGNNLVIEYNEIRHVNLETSDTGAVYTGGRDWISSRGTVIRYNYFHDILGYGYENGKWMSPYFAWGVYLDDNAGGLDVIGNVIARTPRAGIHLHNARDNHIEGNLLLECGLQQFECNGWTPTHRYWSNHLPTMIKGYESVAAEPAWRGMRNMHIHPTNAVTADGKIMTGNEFVRNILAWTNAASALYKFSQVPFDHFVCDSNLVWHAGLPPLTGQQKAGPDLSTNLVINGGFETQGAGGFPAGWRWQERPAGAEAAADGAPGARTLRITGAKDRDAGGRERHAIVATGDFTLEPGAHYRLRARVRSDRPGEKAAVMVQSYVAKVYFWASSPNEIKTTGAWSNHEFVFQVPGPGMKGYRPEMKLFRVRLDHAGDGGTVWVDDIALTRCEELDEWAAWQAMGFDTHSLVANPLIETSAGGCPRVSASSPAAQLGFAPIPVDRIGPYADPRRASWPILEAQGAREKPLVAGTGN